MKRLVLLLAATLWAGCANAQSLSFPGPGSPASAGGGGGSMVFPILSLGGSTTAPNNTAVTYGPLFASTNTNNNFTTIGGVVAASMVSVPGTISGLTVRFPIAVASGTWNVSLYKNSNAAQALTCSVTGGAQTCTNNTPVTVAAGDYVGWRLDPGGTTPTAQANFQIGAVFTSTNPNEAFIPVGNNQASTTVAQYWGFGGNMSANTTRANVESVVPTSGTIDQLYSQGNIAPGVNGYWLTVFLNGNSTALQCRLTTTTPCSDLTHSVAVVAGDLISLEACPGMISAPAPGTGSSCVPGTAPSAALVHSAVRWVPTIPGEYIVMANSPTASPSIGAASYYGIGGGGINAISVESNAYNIAPNNFTIKKAYLSLLTAPGGSGQRGFGLRANGVTVGTPSVIGAGCALTTLTTCVDTNSYSVATNALLDWISTVSGSPAATLGWRVSAVVTVP